MYILWYCFSPNFAHLLGNASTSTITGLSFEWTNGNFTSLQVSWNPVTPPQGGGVTYRVSYTVSPNASFRCACMKEVVTTQAAASSTLLSGLEPNLFYSVMVEVIIQNGLPTDSGKYIHACFATPCSHQIWVCIEMFVMIHTVKPRYIYIYTVHNIYCGLHACTLLLFVYCVAILSVMVSVSVVIISGLPLR